MGMGRGSPGNSSRFGKPGLMPAPDPLERWAHESVVGILALMVRDIQVKLDLILVQFDKLREEHRTMSAELDALTAQVAETNDVEQSAIVLLNGLAAQLAAIANDPAAIAALADSLHVKSDELAAAVVANTPAEP